VTQFTPEQTSKWTADDWASLAGQTVEVITGFSSGPLRVTEATVVEHDMVMLRHAGGGSYLFSTHFGVTVIAEDGS
jgi:hypothetical protein